MKTILRLSLFLLFIPSVFGQVYTLAPIPKLTYLTNTGGILAGYKLCTYAAGSTTPLTSYSNSTGTTNSNPITIDSAGRANVFISSAAYKFVLYAAYSGSGSNTCNGVQVGAEVWSQDNIRDYGLVVYEIGYLTGSGTVNRSAKWTDTDVLGDGAIQELASTEKMRIQTDGTVSIGTTGDAATGLFVLTSEAQAARFATSTTVGTVGLYYSSTNLGGYLRVDADEVNLCNDDCSARIAAATTHVNIVADTDSVLTVESTDDTVAITLRADGVDDASIVANSTEIDICSKTGPCNGGVAVYASGNKVNIFGGSQPGVRVGNSAVDNVCVLVDGDLRLLQLDMGAFVDGGACPF